MTLVLVERNQILVPNLNVKFPCNAQHLTLHCQSDVCVTYCTKRKGKRNVMINVIVASHFIIVKGWRKTVTTYWPPTLIFNKAIKKSVCAESLFFLCS